MIYIGLFLFRFKMGINMFLLFKIFLFLSFDGIFFFMEYEIFLYLYLNLKVEGWIWDGVDWVISYIFFE